MMKVIRMLENAIVLGIISLTYFMKISWPNYCLIYLFIDWK